jgi:hypothetical protein
VRQIAPQPGRLTRIRLDRAVLAGESRESRQAARDRQEKEGIRFSPADSLGGLAAWRLGGLAAWRLGGWRLGGLPQSPLPGARAAPAQRMRTECAADTRSHAPCVDRSLDGPEPDREEAP